MIGTVGEHVRAQIAKLRTEQRMTYVEVSKELAAEGRPIAVLGLRRIELGERRVDVDDLVALAGVFGVDPASLLQGEPQPGAPVATSQRAGSALPTAAEKPLLTREELFALMPDTFRPTATWKAMKSGDLPSIRIGRRLFIPTAELRRLLGLTDA